MIINSEALGDFLQQSKLSIILLLHCKSRFKVEVEKYYLLSGNASMLSLHFFDTFEEAKLFAKNYSQPYYRIVLYEQGKKGNYHCNIETGSWLTRSDEGKFNIINDRYGYPGVFGTDPHGWYLRGLNTHNPEFMEVADDMESMLVEIKRRVNVAISEMKLKKVIRDVFYERHPKLGGRYAQKIECWAVGVFENEMFYKRLFR